MIIQKKSTLVFANVMSGFLLFASTTLQAAESTISVNTPLVELLKQEEARTVVLKHLPNLVEVFEESFEAQAFFGDSSLLELSLDDDHVIGFDDEMLAELRKELNALSEEN